MNLQSTSFSNSLTGNYSWRVDRRLNSTNQTRTHTFADKLARAHTHTHTHTHKHRYAHIYPQTYSYVCSLHIKKVHTLYSSHWDFSTSVSLASRRCIHTIVLTQKKSRFLLSRRLLIRSVFHMIDNLSIAVHTFARLILTSLSVDEILLSMYRNWYTNYRILPLKMVMTPFWELFWTSICIQAWANIFCCLLQGMQQRFVLHGYICLKRLIICVVYVSNSFSRISSASCFFLYDTFFFWSVGVYMYNIFIA